jgi:hypothetical protein
MTNTKSVRRRQPGRIFPEFTIPTEIPSIIVIKFCQLFNISVFVYTSMAILGKMSGNWTYLTPFAVILSISLCLLFVVRKIIEFKKK